MNNEDTVELALTTAINLSDYALQIVEDCIENSDEFNEATPEEHFQSVVNGLTKVLEAHEEGAYAEELEDWVAASYAHLIALSAKWGLFEEQIDLDERE